jgi:hypothetical protein
MSGFFVFNTSAMQNVILNLRNEIIRSISAIDAWFDADRSLLGQPVNESDTVAEYLYKLTLSSRNLLDAITQKSPRKLGGPVDLQFPHDTFVDGSDTPWLVAAETGRVNLVHARAELREQLDRCLIYLEQLLDRQSHMKAELAVEDVENFGGYQGIYLLLIHLKRHLGDLNQVADRRRSNAAQR